MADDGYDPEYDDREPNPLAPTATGDKALRAAFLRAAAAVPAHNPSSDADLKRAVAIEAELLATLPDRDIEGRGLGGELLLAQPLAVDEQARRIRNTLRHPTRLAASADLARLRQADAAGCIDTALDMANTIDAQNNLERALAHQLAAAHNLAMRFSGAALAHGEKAWPAKGHNDAFSSNLREHAHEAARLANAAARMMSAFQNGALALAKMRSGGQQVVVVQHVNVTEGGQAVVAGAVQGRRAGGDPPSQSAPGNQPGAGPEDPKR